MWIKEDITFYREGAPVTGIATYGRYWMHEDVLYAEAETCDQRFYMVDNINTKWMNWYAQQLQVKMPIRFKWLDRCPYADDDPKWVSFLSHSAVSKFELFLKRRREREGKRKVDELLAEAENRRIVEANERKALNEARAAEVRKAAAERDQLNRVLQAQRESDRQRRLAKLSDVLGLPRNDDDLADISLVADGLKVLPVPDAVTPYADKLSDRERTTLIATSNGITLTLLSGYFGVSLERVRQFRLKAERRIARWKHLEQMEKAREEVLNCPKPVLEFHVGPLMEWTAEMQAAEIFAERA